MGRDKWVEQVQGDNPDLLPDSPLINYFGQQDNHTVRPMQTIPCNFLEPEIRLRIRRLLSEGSAGEVRRVVLELDLEAQKRSNVHVANNRLQIKEVNLRRDDKTE